jgi:membrane protease YdiL (CAAX protease family)
MEARLLLSSLRHTIAPVYCCHPERSEGSAFFRHGSLARSRTYSNFGCIRVAYEMIPPMPTPQRSVAFLPRHPAASYFLLTFLISWTCAFAVAAPHLLRHEPLPQLTGVLMFPAMLLGPCLSSFALTAIIDGRAGLRDLLTRLTRWRFSVVWYATLTLPPLLVLLVLLLLRALVSPAYSPNHFWLGISFGIPAGLLEENGWMGFAFPKLTQRRDPFSSAIILGLLWSFWHLPVINFLGAATPHGRYWFPFFLAFAAAMIAMRVLICWVYANTRSVLLAQLLHISSTSSLVVFSPAVSAAREAFWYALYAAALWLIVLLIRRIYGKRLSISQT